MNGLADFLAMGGYAPYVWPAYGVAVLVLGLVWTASARRARKAADDLAATGSAAPTKSGRS